jgi:hypothetical protein
MSLSNYLTYVGLRGVLRERHITTVYADAMAAGIALPYESLCVHYARDVHGLTGNAVPSPIQLPSAQHSAVIAVPEWHHADGWLTQGRTCRSHDTMQHPNVHSD